MDHHLGGERVVIGGESTAVIEGGIHPHAGAAGEVEELHLTGAGTEVRRRVLSVDAALDGVAGESHLLLRDVQRQAGGDAQLLAHEVDAGDELGDAVLHLNACVHLHEVEMPSVGGEQKLHRPGSLIAHRLSRLYGSTPHFLAQLRRQAAGGSLLDELLVPALDGAVAVSQMDDAALPIR